MNYLKQFLTKSIIQCAKMAVKHRLKNFHKYLNGIYKISLNAQNVNIKLKIKKYIQIYSFLHQKIFLNPQQIRYSPKLSMATIAQNARIKKKIVNSNNIQRYLELQFFLYKDLRQISMEYIKKIQNL